MAKAIRQYNTRPFRLPPELEQRLKALALPPDVVQRFRELALSPDARRRLRLEIPVEWDIPPELVQAAEEVATPKPPAEPPPQEAPPVVAPIATKDWFAAARKDHPKRKGESGDAWAKRLHGLMQGAPVTKLWSKGTCRRRLYRDN